MDMNLGTLRVGIAADVSGLRDGAREAIAQVQRIGAEVRAAAATAPAIGDSMKQAAKVAAEAAAEAARAIKQASADALASQKQLAGEAKNATKTAAEAYKQASAEARAADAELRKAIRQGAEDSVRAQKEAAAAAAQATKQAAESSLATAKQSAKDAAAALTKAHKDAAQAAKEAAKVEQEAAEAVYRAHQAAAEQVREAARKEAEAHRRAAEEAAAAAKKQADEAKAAADREAAAVKAALEKVGTGFRTVKGEAAAADESVGRLLKKHMMGEALTGSIGRVSSAMEQLAGITKDKATAEFERWSGRAVNAVGNIIQALRAGPIAGAIALIASAIQLGIQAFTDMQREAEEAAKAAADAAKTVSDEWSKVSDEVKKASDALKEYRRENAIGGPQGGITSLQDARLAQSDAQIVVDSIKDQIDPIKRRMEILNRRRGPDGQLVTRDDQRDYEKLKADLDALMEQARTAETRLNQAKSRVSAATSTAELERQKYALQSALSSMQIGLSKEQGSAEDSGTVSAYGRAIAFAEQQRKELAQLKERGVVDPNTFLQTDAGLSQLSRSLRSRQSDIFGSDLAYGASQAARGAGEAGTSAAFTKAVETFREANEKFQASIATEAQKRAFGRAADEQIRALTAQGVDLFGAELKRNVLPAAARADFTGSTADIKDVLSLLSDVKSEFMGRTDATDAQKRAFGDDIDSQIAGWAGKFRDAIAKGFTESLASIQRDAASGGLGGIISAVNATREARGAIAGSADLAPQAQKGLLLGADDQAKALLGQGVGAIQRQFADLEEALSGIRSLSGNQLQIAIDAAGESLDTIRINMEELAELGGDALPDFAELRKKFATTSKQAGAAAERGGEEIKDKLNQMVSAIGNAIGGNVGAVVNLVNGIKGLMTDIKDVADAAADGASAGGGWGAIIAAIIQLLSNLSSFSYILDALNRFIQAALEGLEPVLNAFAPFFDLFVEIIAVISQVSDIMGPMIPILRAIFDVLKGLLEGLVIIFALSNWALKKAFNSIMWELAKLADSIGWDSAAEWIRDAMFDIPGTIEGALAQATEGIDKLDYGEIQKKADDFGNQLEKAGNQAANALNEVTGYRLAAATYDSMDTRGLKPHASGGRVVGINDRGEAITVQDGEGIASVGVGETIQKAGASGGGIIDARQFVTVEQVNINARDGDETKLWGRIKRVWNRENIGADGMPFDAGLPFVGVPA